MTKVGPDVETERLPAVPTLNAAPTPAHPSAARRLIIADEPPSYSSCHWTVPQPDPVVPPHGTGRARSFATLSSNRPFHAAPRIVIDIPTASENARASEFQRTSRNSAYWPVRRCYEAGLRRDPKLGGRVELELAVAADGTVESAEGTGTTLKDALVAACVVREAGQLKFAPAETSSKATAEVTLSPGDLPVFVPPPIPKVDSLVHVLREQWPRVEDCFGRELDSHPNAGGPMELRFRVEPEGRVVDVVEGEIHFEFPNVTACVLSVYRASTFPSSQNSRVTQTFVYALHLESAR